MSIIDSLAISRCPEWSTPPELFGLLDAEFAFTVDACATDSNHKLPRYWTAADDGLSKDWRGERVWMNPPYGPPITDWVRKAAESARDGALVVGLLPNRTDTRWWADWVSQATEIRFLTGRVRFGDAGTGAPFGSAVAVWGGGARSPIYRQWDWRSEL